MWIVDFLRAGFAFTIAAAASWVLAKAFPAFKLPIITGYLVIGIACGPSGTDLITSHDVETLSQHINAFALAFIAFAAGEEIFLPDLQTVIRKICQQLAAVSLLTFVFVSSGFFVMLRYYPSVFGDRDDDDDVATSWTSVVGAQIAISMLMGSIMAARSPASAVAIVKELEAEGDGTKLMLGVTVLSDVVVLLLFSVTSSLASVLCAIPGANGDKQNFDPLTIVILCGELIATCGLGWALGKIIDLVLALPVRRLRVPYNPYRCVVKTFKGTCRLVGIDCWSKTTATSDDETQVSVDSFMIYRSYVKGTIILIIGWGVFILTDLLAKYPICGRHVRIESLLVCMIGSCYVSHHASSSRRRTYARILSRCARYVFLPFFTLAGASLDIPSVLSGWAVAVILCAIRVISIAIGSVSVDEISRRVNRRRGRGLDAPLVITSTKRADSADEGGIVVTFEEPVLRTEKEETRQRIVGRYLWLTLIAQAGVALGLAIEVQRTFPGWGDRFANVVLSIIVLNQIIGPVMCKFGLSKIIDADASVSAASTSCSARSSFQGQPSNDEDDSFMDEDGKMPDAFENHVDDRVLDKRWSCPPEMTFHKRLRLARVPSGSAYLSLLTNATSTRRRRTASLGMECETPAAF